MTTAIAASAKSIPTSGIREIANLAMERPGCIRLEMGEPDFATPEHIADAGRQAIFSGKTRYTATSGLRSLRELITQKLRLVNGIEVSPDQVVVSAGGVNAIYAALATVLDVDDEVLVPNPAWPNYVMQVNQCGGKVREYALDPITFLPTLEALERCITSKTKVIVVNSPSNPGGAVIPSDLCVEIVRLAEKHDCFILSDEVYDQIVFDAVHTSLYPLNPDRVISVYSFSKTYAMTGWRLGYLVARLDLAAAIDKVQEAVVSCASQVSQEAGLVALSGDQDVIRRMKDAYQLRRDVVVEKLRKQGMYRYTPAGAFYILVDVSASGVGSREYALGLLNQYGVAVAPGSAFGSNADHVVRVSLASSLESLETGIDAIAAYVREVGPGV